MDVEGADALNKIIYMEAFKEPLRRLHANNADTLVYPFIVVFMWLVMNFYFLVHLMTREEA